MTAPDCPSDRQKPLSRRLSLLDATSIVVGIVIGAGLYETAPIVARNVPGPLWMAGVWIAGGVIALLGAATYAELTTTYTEPGGEFAFLSRAYGNRLGFVFAWSQLWVVRPGSIGAMAFIFGNYWRQLFPWGGHARVEMLYALAAIVLLSIVCGMGIRPGVWTQNFLTGAKVVGLLLIVLVAFLAPAVPTDHRQLAESVGEQGDLRLALILVLFTYGGWNDMAYVAAEVRRPRKNLVRALFLGTLAVTVIYVAINGAFVHVLGMEGVRHSRAVAADTVRIGLGQGADRAISLLICLSCLGAIHGMLLTGSRIYYAMGTRYPFFATLGTWNQRRGSPTTSLILQTGITVAVVLGFGLYENSFQRMVVFTTPIFWFFFLLTGLSLFVLRWKYRSEAAPRTTGRGSQDGPQTGVSAVKEPSEAAPWAGGSCSHAMPRSQDGPAVEKPNRSQGFRVIGYPLTPGLFCLACLLMLVESVAYAFEHRAAEAVWSTLLLAIGCLLSVTAAGRAGGETAGAGTGSLSSKRRDAENGGS